MLRSRTSNTSLGYTWVISPSVINDSRAGYFRRLTETSVASYGGDWPSKLGIPNVDNALMPAFTTESASATNKMYNMIGQNPNRNVNETISWRNDTTWIKNSHAFKFGYEILRFRLNSANLARYSTFVFDDVTADLQPNGQPAPNTGIPFAGLLTGYAKQGVFNAELTSWLPRSTIHSFYVQDDWKITPTLTLNIGVRYSNESPFSTKNGMMSNFDPLAKDDLTGMTGAFIHPTGSLSQRDNNNFQPRVGLAWHPFNKWVIRGGFGIYTIDVKFPQSRGQFDEYVATANQQPAPGDPTPVFRLSQGPRADSIHSSSEFYFSVRRYELRITQRRVVGPQSAKSVCDEFQCERPIRIRAQLPIGCELPGLRRRGPGRTVAGEHLPDRLFRGQSDTAEYRSGCGPELPAVSTIRRRPLPVELRPLDLSRRDRED